MTITELTEKIIESAVVATKVNVDNDHAFIHFTRYTDLELLDEFNLEEIITIDFYNDFEGITNLCNEVNKILKKHTVFYSLHGMYPRSIFEEMEVPLTIIDQMYSGKFVGVHDNDYVIAYCLKANTWKLYKTTPKYNGFKPITSKK